MKGSPLTWLRAEGLKGGEAERLATNVAKGGGAERRRGGMNKTEKI